MKSVIICDMEGIIQNLNKDAEEMFGVFVIVLCDIKHSWIYNIWWMLYFNAMFQKLHVQYGRFQIFLSFKNNQLWLIKVGDELIE